MRPSLKIGNKDITAFNLVRVGAAIAHKPAIYGSPKYGDELAWSMKSVPELTSFAKRCIALFHSKPFGPYEATKFIFGAEAATALAIDSAAGVGQYLAPHPPPKAAPPRYRRPRDAPDATDSSDNDVEVIEGPLKRRRTEP